MEDSTDSVKGQFNPHSSINTLLREDMDTQMDFTKNRPTSETVNLHFSGLINDEPEFSLTSRRFLVYFFFGMSILICSANSLLFAADAKLLSDEFDISVIWLTQCSNVFNFTYVPLTLCAARMYRTMSAATVIRIACLLLLSGAWVRILFHYLDNVFWPLLLGQTLIACAFPILSSAITLIATRWCAD